MVTYEQAMDMSAARYRDVLEKLAGVGLPATFIQTGRMCAAIEVVLEGGHLLLVADADDTLAWERETHQEWGVGLYRPDGEGSHFDDGPMINDITAA